MTALTSLPDLDWPDYTAALKRRAVLAADLRQAQQDLAALPALAEAAAKADEDAHAAAILDGKAPPKTRAATAKQAHEAEGLKQHAAALANALATQDAACARLVRVNLVTAQDVAVAQQVAAEDRYRDALAELAQARAACFLSRQTTAWLQAGASRRWKPTSPPPLRIPGVVQANGEPVPTSAVLDALAEEAEGRYAGPRTVPVYTPGADQRTAGIVANVPLRTPDPLGGPHATHVVMVAPDRLSEVQVRADRLRASLARDRQENLDALAALSPAEQIALRYGKGAEQRDDLADLREGA